MIDMYCCHGNLSRWQRKNLAKVRRHKPQHTAPAIVPHHEEPDCGCPEIDPCDPCDPCGY